MYKNKENTYVVTGDLDMHGVKKSISAPATITKADNMIKLSSTFTVSRVDFGVKYEGKTNDLVKDEFELDVELVAVSK